MTKVVTNNFINICSLHLVQTVSAHLTFDVLLQRLALNELIHSFFGSPLCNGGGVPLSLTKIQLLGILT